MLEFDYGFLRWKWITAGQWVNDGESMGFKAKGDDVTDI